MVAKNDNQEAEVFVVHCENLLDYVAIVSRLCWLRRDKDFGQTLVRLQNRTQSAKEHPSTAILAEEQLKAGSADDLIDLDLDPDNPRKCQSRLQIKHQMRRLIKRSKII